MRVTNPATHATAELISDDRGLLAHVTLASVDPCVTTLIEPVLVVVVLARERLLADKAHDGDLLRTPNEDREMDVHVQPQVSKPPQPAGRACGAHVQTSPPDRATVRTAIASTL